MSLSVLPSVSVPVCRFSLSCQLWDWLGLDFGSQGLLVEMELLARAAAQTSAQGSVLQQRFLLALRSLGSEGWSALCACPGRPSSMGQHLLVEAPGNGVSVASSL